MKLKDAMRKMVLDVAGKAEICLDGEHCGLGPDYTPRRGMVIHDHTGPWHQNITFGQHHGHYHRYVYPHLFDVGDEYVPATAYVYYRPIDINEIMTVDGIVVIHGGTAAGNLYVALYDATLESPVNRLAVSASTSCAGLTNQKHSVLFTAPLQLNPGYYFLAFEPDNNTDSYAFGMCHVRAFAPAGVNNGPSFYYENLGGYVIPPAVATPTQYIGTGAAYCQSMILRVVSTP